MRPRVRQLVRRYKMRSRINPDSAHDIAAWVELGLKLDPMEAVVRLSLGMQDLSSARQQAQALEQAEQFGKAQAWAFARGMRPKKAWRFAHVQSRPISAPVADVATAIGDLLRRLHEHKDVLEALPWDGLPKRAGRKPNPARQALVLGLGLEWESMGLVVAISKSAAAMGRLEAASGPFVRACTAATSDLPWHLRLTPDAVVSEVQTLRNQGLLRRI